MDKKNIQDGSNLYDDRELTLLSGKGKPDEIEEYIEISNEYEKKKKYINKLEKELSRLYDIEANSEIAGGFAYFISFGFSLCFTIPYISGGFSDPNLILTAILVPTIGISFSKIVDIFTFGFKTTRKESIEETNDILQKEKVEMEELKTKRNELIKKINYSEKNLYEDKIVPVTTRENKKVTVKRRVLNKDQSR